MKKRIISLILLVAMVLGMTSMVSAASHPFTDVPSGKWYSEHVQYVYDEGLMSGTSATKFDPDGTMTRAMVVTVLYRLAGSPTASQKNPFTDVPSGKWFTDPVVWAVANGITSGTTATTFGPNAKVTREQLVTFLYRYATFIDESLVAGYTVDLSSYADQNNVAQYAKLPFSWAVANGIISGTDATHLSPKGSATRAQCATILSRFDKWMKGDTDTTKPHEHNYIAQNIIPPTCTEAGYVIYKCSCGDSYNGNEVEATGHNYSTQTDGSLTIYICQTCGYEYSEGSNVEINDEFKREVAKYVVQYINLYRNEQGSRTCEVLPGMTLVAEYRADQLTTNFAHDTKDEREAHAYYEYGEYIDATKFGDPAENSYWTSHANEAIGYGAESNYQDAESIGKRFATACWNSESHWSYIGDDMYSYIAVGMEYVAGQDNMGTWYCCIMVNDRNYG